MIGGAKAITYIITDLMGQYIQHYYELMQEVNFTQQTYVFIHEIPSFL
jgi:hypothetical protein